MKKRDALELTRRMKKEGCTFTRMCGCYVNPGKEKVVTFGKTFLNLEDDEFYKYLEIAKKTLSGAVGDQLLPLDGFIITRIIRAVKSLFLIPCW